MYFRLHNAINSMYIHSTADGSDSLVYSNYRGNLQVDHAFHAVLV